MKLTLLATLSGASLAGSPLAAAPNSDPYVFSWLTAHSGKYARIYTNNALKLSGTSLTTRGNGSQTQSSPASAAPASQQVALPPPCHPSCLEKFLKPRLFDPGDFTIP